MTHEELLDALDGLCANDIGALDSGIHDENLRARCVAELKQRTTPPDGGRVFFAVLVRDMFLTDAAIAEGRGVADVMKFVDWLDDQMGVRLR